MLDSFVDLTKQVVKHDHASSIKPKDI